MEIENRDLAAYGVITMTRFVEIKHFRLADDADSRVVAFLEEKGRK